MRTYAPLRGEGHTYVITAQPIAECGSSHLVPGIYTERIYTVKPLMSVHKLLICSVEYHSVRLDRTLCCHHCLLVRLSSSAECERCRSSHGSSLCAVTYT